MVELVVWVVGMKLFVFVGLLGSGKLLVLRVGLLFVLVGGVLLGSDGWVQSVIWFGVHLFVELWWVECKLRREVCGLFVID